MSSANRVIICRRASGNLRRRLPSNKRRTKDGASRRRQCYPSVGLCLRGGDDPHRLQRRRQQTCPPPRYIFTPIAELKGTLLCVRAGQWASVVPRCRASKAHGTGPPVNASSPTSVTSPCMGTFAPPLHSSEYELTCHVVHKQLRHVRPRRSHVRQVSAYTTPLHCTGR